MALGATLLKIGAYSVTIILTLFLGLLLLAWIGSRYGSPVPDFEGYDTEDEEERVPITSEFETSTVDHFLRSASVTGIMPGGEKTALPLLPKDELESHFSGKYANWAVEKWSTIPFRPKRNAPRSGDAPETTLLQDSPSPLFHVMQIMSGHDGVVDMSMYEAVVERSAKSMKSKIWFGMAPITDARWASENLDQRENIEEALAIIQQVVEIFKYLRRPPVQGTVRDIHNHIWVEIDIFDDGIDALYASQGKQAPEWKLAKIWREYAGCHYQFLESQARAWIFKRLLVLHTAWKNHFISVMQSGTQLNETQTTVKIDHYAMMVTNKILDLYTEADLYVRFPTHGFSLANGIDQRLVAAIDGKTPAKQLNRIYEKIENGRISAMKKHLKLALSQKEKEWHQVHQTPSFMKPVARMSCREFAHKMVQPEFETPLPLKMEPWIQDVSDHDTLTFGFVIYRASYTQPNEQWIQFLGRLEAGLNCGWNGLVGAYNAQKKATLEWIDGRNHKIEEGDLNSVRSHFQESVASKAFPYMANTVCLAVTAESIESFSHNSSSSRGFVHAIDPSFTTADTQDDAGSYPGVFKIIDQLIWTDLYALHARESCQTLKDFWYLAEEHPEKTYVGPITGVRRRQWRKRGEKGTSAAVGSNQDEDTVDK